jgi:hypothetical protein
MALGWYELTGLTGKKEYTVTSIKFKESNIVINGDFELPPLAQLSHDDQVFVAHFIRTHGSIKEMEQAFGVSYPTIKARLNKISSKLQFVEIAPVSKKEEIISQLERGEINANEAVEKLRSSYGA